jgi:peptidoglycan L-alanyl-D-glutamate endopeptidase CwlK
MQTVDIAAAAIPPQTTPLPLAPTPELVHQLFPFTPLANIAANLPHILTALASANLTGKPMLLMALATIRAEAESFLPLTESESRFNTSPGGAPFDLYDRRRDLGNQGPPDGALFRGRGFVQLTGRANYTRYAHEINQPLVTNPDLAASPAVAAELLAHFLAAHTPAIRRAVAANDLALARRLVNGGANGLDRFTAAYQIGVRVLASNSSSVAQI